MKGRSWKMACLLTAALALLPAVASADTMTADSDGTEVCTTWDGESGVDYSGTVSGTFRYRTPQDNSRADAAWRSDVTGTWESSSLIAWDNARGLIYANTAVNPTYGQSFHSNHVYSFSVAGDGTPLCFKVGDSWYPDNDGGLTVTVTRPGMEFDGGGGGWVPVGVPSCDDVEIVESFFDVEQHYRAFVLISTGCEL